jgi:hypothetical protein
MKRLVTAISQIKLLEKEIADLDKLDAKAQQELKDASDPRLDFKTARQKITDARATIELVEGKRKALAQLHSIQEDKLATGCKRLIAFFNGEIAGCEHRAKNEVISSNLNQFGGDEAACRNFWEGRMQELPSLRRFTGARYDEDLVRIGKSLSVCASAEHFVRHVESNAPRFGLDSFLLSDIALEWTESELREVKQPAPGEDEQRAVVSLRQLHPRDPFRKAAEGQIERITNRPGWTEPAKISVRNTASHPVLVDGEKIERGGYGLVYPWQLRALQRFLEPAEAPTNVPLAAQ